jgi:hypothetical protein
MIKMELKGFWSSESSSLIETGTLSTSISPFRIRNCRPAKYSGLNSDNEKFGMGEVATTYAVASIDFATSTLGIENFKL